MMKWLMLVMLVLGMAGCATTSVMNPKRVAADIQDAATIYAAVEGKDPAKRKSIVRAAGLLETLSASPNADPSVIIADGGNTDDVLRAAILRMLLRRAGVDPGQVQTQEQVREIASSAARGLRAGLGTK